MKMTSQVSLLIKRYYQARRFGVQFRGTTTFRIPAEVSNGESTVLISSPDDEALKYDFINIWLDDEYRLSEVPKPNNVVDIGGNIGLFSLWAHITYGDINLHVYEPNMSLHPYIQRNLSILRNPTVHGEAVGAHEGLVELSSADSSRLTRVISSDTSGHANIPLVSIAAVIERSGGSVDLLKMDCEGGEWDILSDVTALQGVRYIVMEYHLFDGRKFSDLEALAKGASFEIKYHNEKNAIVHLVNRRQ